MIRLSIPSTVISPVCQALKMAIAELQGVEVRHTGEIKAKAESERKEMQAALKEVREAQMVPATDVEPSRICVGDSLGSFEMRNGELVRTSGPFPAQPEKIADHPSYAEFAGACFDACGTQEGLTNIFAAVTGMLAAFLADVPEQRLETVLSQIATFEDGEQDPDPELTAAMVAYLRVEAKHGRETVAAQEGRAA